MNYQTALDYIWGLVNFETHPPATRAPYTLERMVAIMHALGDPQTKLKVAHVAGTKGKGSTAAMMAAVLQAAGHRTGLYSSPHLHDARERLQINGAMIAEPDFTALVTRLRPLFDSFDGATTTFEALTAMAFVYFAEQGCDVVVLEVGLGGRLDATNLVTPLVSVITPLGLEHTAVLGNTIEEIASEKGGIIKASVPVVVAAQPPAALDVLHDMADTQNAPLTVVPWQAQATITKRELGATTFDMSEEGKRRYQGLRLRLMGDHQASNALVAIAALDVLHSYNIGWDEEALRTALQNVNWPARIELIGQNPTIIADGAHTVESARALLETLRNYLPTLPPLTLILGVSQDKAIAPLLAVFAPVLGTVILTQANHPRAADPVALAEIVHTQGYDVTLTTSVAEAMTQALHLTPPNGLIVATGSLFVAAEARAWQATP